MNFRPATAEDMIAVDGALPPKTCRALVAEDNGKVECVFGIYQHSTRYVLFSSCTDEFRTNKRAVVKAVRKMWEIIAQRPPMPLLAHADPEIKGSDVLLNHMGFERLTGDVFQCLGHR